MLRNFTAPILFLSAIISLAVNAVFAQSKPLDKNTLARFEKSIAQKKIEEIERPLLDLAVSNPNNPRVLELLADVRRQQNRLSEAAALYKRVLTLDADSATAKINLARISYVSGQTDEARKMLASIAENSISSDALRLNLAAAFLQTGAPDAALAMIEKLSLKTKSGNALPVIAASYAALKNEAKLRELLPLIKRAAKTNPNLILPSAEALQNAGMNREAADLLRFGLAAAPNDFDVLIALGKLEIAVKDLAAAKEHLKRAAELQPRNARLFTAQALLADAQGNYSAALELLKRAETIAPAAPEILSQIVLTAIRANQSRTAIEAAQTLTSAKPNEPDYLYLLGAAFLQGGDTARAQSNLQRLMELRPTDSRGCLALGLTFAAQSDQLENARKQLAHCIEIDARNVEAKYQLGLSYKAQGENAKAVEYLEATVESAPNYAAALRDLGASYLQTGAEDKARIALEKAVALAPEDADTHFQLSRLYNLIGETALAKKHLELFQKLKNAPKSSM